MWVAITFAAATFQILRTSRQHRLRANLSTNAAGFVRYAYAAPLAAILFAIWFGAADHAVPTVAARFWWIVAVAGLGQILGTYFLLASFKARSFAIGTVYSKAEIVIVGLLGMAATGDTLGPAAWAGVLTCTVGVASLASHGSLRAIVSTPLDRAALLGIGAGAGFAIASVAIRAGTQSLDGGTSWDKALVTLTVMLTFQLLANGAHLLTTDRPSLVRVFRSWRAALPIGILSLAGSAAWAWAMALEAAAKVRTLGQVELLIAFAVARITLRERHTRAENVASALVLAGVVLVVAG